MRRIALAWLLALALQASGAPSCVKIRENLQDGNDQATWVINNAALDGSRSIQSFVDCIPEGGRLRIAHDVVTNPSHSISLTKPIVLEGSVDTSDSEPNFDCGALLQGEPLISIRGHSITLSKFFLRNCSGKMPAIIDIQASRNITLSTLTFRANEAIGVWVNDTSGVTKLHDVRFENNTGRALAISNSEVEVTNGSFKGNSNGAIDITGLNTTKVRIVNSTFEKNTYSKTRGRGDYGAAIHLRETEAVSLNVEGCTFKKNTVRFLGGAVFIGWLKPQAEVRFEKCKFVHNSAGDGGALYIQGYWWNSRPTDLWSRQLYKSIGDLHIKKTSRSARFSERNAKVHLVGCTFTENKAKQSSGAVWTSQELHVAGSKFTNNNCTDSNGWGGALMIQAPTLVEASIFHGNAAERGGALFVKIDDGKVPQSGFSRKILVVASRVEFSGNAALDGGAILLDRTIAHFPFWGQGLNFTGNKALRGGGLCTLGHQPLESVQNPLLVVGVSSQGAVLSSPSMEIVNSSFSTNQGGDSGGAVYSHKDFVAFGHTKFLANLSKGQGGGIRLDQSLCAVNGAKFEGNQAETGGGMCMDDSVMVGWQTEFVKNTVVENGGAISATISNVETRKEPNQMLGAIDCTECDFDGNVAAASGGAIFFSQQINLDAQNAACSPSPQKTYPITHGPIIHYLETSRFTQICEAALLLLARLKSLRVTLKSTRMTRNKASLAGGGVFTSTMEALKVVCRDKSEHHPAKACPGWDGNAIDGGNGYGPVFASPLMSAKLSERQVLDHKSGDPLPPFNVTLLDGWGQVMRGSESLRVDLKGTHDLLSGQRSGTPTAGIATFTKTVVRARPGTYVLKVSLPSSTIKDLIMEVQIRECRIGELETHNGMECEMCHRSYFSFDPSELHCRVCPPNAMCDGYGATVVPKPGYWQSTSRSLVLHQCLAPLACEFPGREELLTEKAKLSHWANRTLTFKDDYQLCHTGFEGVLCGSCAPGYGRVQGLECEECRKGRKLTYFWIVLGTVISLFVVGVFLTDMLSAEDPQIDSSYLRDEIEEIELVTAAGLIGTDGGTTSWESTQDSAIVLGTDDSEPLERTGSALRKKGENVTEATKILVNFLQLTALGLTIDLRWTKSLSTLLLLAGWIGTTFEPLDVELVNLDCLFEDGQILPRMVLTFFFPFFALVIFVAFWSVARFRAQDEDLNHCVGFGRRCWLTTLAVLFISYTAITKNVYKVMYCISVDEEEEGGIVVARWYWAEDTNFACYTGAHARLFYSLCMPFLLVITLGFPFALFFKLYTKKGRHGEKSCRRTYGFLYACYTPRCYYWETIIMFRKALIAAVAIWTRGLGPNLQGLLTAFILVTALLLHLTAKPFRDRRLNNCETMSLMASIIVFFAGLVLMDENATRGFAITVSCAVFLVFFGLIFVTFWYMLRWEGGLGNMVVRLMTEHPILGTIAKLVRFCLSRIPSRGWRWRELRGEEG